METGTVVAIAAVGVGGLILYMVIRDNNQRSEQRTTTVNQNAPALGETGGIVFGALTGLSNLVGSIGRVANNSNRSASGVDPTRPVQGPGYQLGTSFIAPTNNFFDYYGHPQT